MKKDRNMNDEKEQVKEQKTPENPAVPAVPETPELSRTLVKNGVKYEWSLPGSAMAQFDLYTAMMAYWNEKTPALWNTVKAYVVANTKITEVKTGIELNIRDLDFGKVKTMVEGYLELATAFFTCPRE